jgi:transposase
MLIKRPESAKKFIFFKIYGWVVPAKRGRGRPPADAPPMFRGMYYILRTLQTGCPWRDLPRDFGCLESVCTGYWRWCKSDLDDMMRSRNAVLLANANASHRATQAILARSDANTTAKIHTHVPAPGLDDEIKKLPWWDAKKVLSSGGVTNQTQNQLK